MSSAVGHVTHQPAKEKHPISSHTICPLISGNCDREIIANCGEQNPERFRGLPAKICPHARIALLRYAATEGLKENDTIMTGRGDTASIRPASGQLLASVTRGTMTTSTKRVN